MANGLDILNGILGGLGGFALCYWSSVIEYPLNIGGRPFNSWVAFIPPVFGTTILLAALTAVFGMLALNGLPEPYHPVFNVPAFALASRDKFLICIEATDPRFDRAETRRFLESLPGQSGVYEVEHSAPRPCGASSPRASPAASRRRPGRPRG